ncbi:MAG TPA: methyl-accepting chemotaxis protein [Bacillota bacterium]|jgi:methyl-accepting chemotaxis protein|nr:methyl-accepting chemotaxis protein [Bacillota bacterium]HQE66545.1 methyl-accepting chemotaxis protein [Bacillota bacterium]HQI16218.1 methyl-accepting chemotaxis protein [Bacillota bacterium]HQJ37295.1 methyl-accepting chemotaxis protein [Bacillota bacterium]HRU41384.1 methyl-accepting chemotaxis protein [Candidatus Diapherotrites archaeon]
MKSKSNSKRIKFSIGKKIILGFLAVVVVFSASTIYSYNTIKSLNIGYEKLINETTKSAILAEGMKSDALEKVQCLSKFIISGDDKNLDLIAEYDISFNEKKYNLEKLLVTDESKNALKALSNANSEYNNLIEEIKALLVNKEDERVMEVINGKGAQILEDIVISADTIVILAESSLDKGNEAQSANGQAVITNLLILTFTTIIVSVLLSLYISRVISKPVVKLSASVEKIAEGDLTVDDINISNKDEIGDLAKSFNKMLASLKTIAEKTMQSSYGVAASARELMAGSEAASSALEEIVASMQDVSMGIENQKFNIDSISSAMDETSAEIEQIASNMQYVSNNAVTLSSLSNKGYEALKDVINQMEKISTRSKDSVEAVRSLEAMSERVEAVTNMITEISGQTNLLALNAAIEAARAGEQGRGFSVVAEEVRKLAEQSSSAASEISNIIRSMNDQIRSIVSIIEDEASEVHSGTKVVGQANSSFEEISKGVDSIISQVQGVSAATQQITSGIEQVVAATGEILEAASNNSSNVQNVSIAIEEQTASVEIISNKAAALSELAVDLDSTVSIFKVKQ